MYACAHAKIGYKATKKIQITCKNWMQFVAKNDKIVLFWCLFWGDQLQNHIFDATNYRHKKIASNQRCNSKRLKKPHKFVELLIILHFLSQAVLQGTLCTFHFPWLSFLCPSEIIHCLLAFLKSIMIKSRCFSFGRLAYKLSIKSMLSILSGFIFYFYGTVVLQYINNQQISTLLKQYWNYSL